MYITYIYIHINTDAYLYKTRGRSRITGILEGLHPFDVSLNICKISFSIVTSLM